MSTTLSKSDFDLSQIINGVTIIAPSPFGFHQDIISNLVLLIGNHAKLNKSGKILTSPLDVIFEKGYNVIQPDLIYIRKENMSIFDSKGYIHGVPDLLIEIVSTSSVSRDTVEKYKIYEKYGVSEYWIVFPELKVVEVFVLKDGKYSLFCSTENTEGVLSSVILTDFKVKVEEVFEG
jgi:Uma2 family endonuclease